MINSENAKTYFAQYMNYNQVYVCKLMNLRCEEPDCRKCNVPIAAMLNRNYLGLK